MLGRLMNLLDKINIINQQIFDHQNYINFINIQEQEQISLSTIYTIPIKMNETEGLQTECSVNPIYQCLVKSKYFQTWAHRQITLSLDQGLLQVICPKTARKKSYILDQVYYNRHPKQNCISLRVSPHRTYQIRNNSAVDEILKQIDYYHKCKALKLISAEETTPVPKKINYHYNKVLKVQKQNTKTVQHQHKQEKIIEKRHPSSYERWPQYIKSSDWRRNPKNGQLLFINEQKKYLIPQMIKYTAKKVVTSGQFLNVNFPTFAMKPESALQTYCRCLGAVPLIMHSVKQDPIEKIKAFNAIILTLSVQLNDMQKSFNPLLGETFQGQIAGNYVCAQQISTSPLISSFLFIGENYRLSGSLELIANIGFNQAIGVFHGELTLQFNDGGIVKGIMPQGVMNGVLFGDIKFGPIGSVYSYDPINKIVCSYETKKGDLMTGQIGILKNSEYQKFILFVKNNNKQNFKHISQRGFQHISSRMEVYYSDSISYDNKKYWSYSSEQNLPIKMTKDFEQKKIVILESDSTHRKDIKLRGQQKIKQSQHENDRLQKQQERIKMMKTKFLNRQNKAYHSMG